MRTEIRRGERVPEGVEVEAFRGGLSRRSHPAGYRYISRDRRTYIAEPHERQIIDEID